MALLLGAFSLMTPALAAPALAAPMTPATAAGGNWQLADGHGDRWGLALFTWPAGDAAAAADQAAAPARGWRLRLTARSPQTALEHQLPLQLGDGLGQHWSLPNRSDELVAGAAPLPAGSAQFDLDALLPRPNPVLPLQLEVLLRSAPGTASTTTARQLTLPADLVAALSALPAESAAADR